MGRTEFPNFGQETFPTVGSDFPAVPAHKGHTDPATAHVEGDVFASNWESAWIDLGGEG